MSQKLFPQKDTFKVFHSEEDSQELLVFIKKNAAVLNRLHDALSSAPCKIEDSFYVFDEPIHLTVNAERILLSPNGRKRKIRFNGSFSLSFSIRSLDTAPNAAWEMLIPTAIGCMRIRDAIRSCNLLHKAGFDASDTLTELDEVFIHQIVSLSHQMLHRMPR
ncbi:MULTISPECIES: hypothetical protein [unclassified Rhizobium]|uniref:hypothetical protein n=1 Tax=unclassified Rhizobium TaxID=2613769 RepID=UPI001AE14272|nr:MULTISPECIES: hypothetical protein [unclassified Rhizobium]MBP2460183.1 hypothetical protein [Rhizobium sp. PvP014]MBP2531542.1 hypothetical protein [Rhizobium sp. PvP099]